jgi:hypothetical protein
MHYVIQSGPAACSIAMDFINAFPGNSPVNTFQHTPRNNGGTCIFYVMTSSTKEMVFSAGSVQSAYKRSEFRSID